jgi:hypothetical protein
MNGVQDPDPFRRLVAALEPWLDQVVIVGGWAHRLYRLHPHAQDLDYPPLMTLDTDVAVPAKLPVGEQNICARLLDHGFTEEFLGDDHPPATHYRLGGEASGFYAEFLTPLVGSEYDRNHKRKATMEIAGIASQQLRHIDLLLQHPWSIDFESDGVANRIRIANPVSFLAQKIIIHKKRDLKDRAKDTGTTARRTARSRSADPHAQPHCRQPHQLAASLFRSNWASDWMHGRNCQSAPR